MSKMERLGCLYLTFLNSGQGLSFSKIKQAMPGAYEGDPETARRKFERDKDSLSELGLNLEFYAAGEPLPSGNPARENVYLPADEIESLPDLKLTDGEAASLAGIILYTIENKPDHPDSDLFRSAALKLLYKNPHLLTDPPKHTSTIDVREEKQPFLADLQIAIRKRYLCVLNYPDHSGDGTERKVEPRGLISHRGRWCLVGISRDVSAIRYFYLDRILDLKVTKTVVKADTSFKIQDHSLHALTISIHQNRRITFQFDLERSDVLMDLLAGMPDKKYSIKKDVAVIETTNQEALFNFMIRYPAIIQSMEPEEARNDFKKYLSSIAENYEK